MSELQQIESALQLAARRRRRERALRGLWQGVFVGTLIWFVALAIYKVAPIPVGVLEAAAAAGLASPIVGFVIGGWRKTSISETARWVDGKQHLQERLSTALELARGPGSETWRELLVNDAAAHLKDLDPLFERQLVHTVYYLNFYA